MDREKLHLVEAERNESAQRFMLLVQGKKEVPADLRKRTLQSLSVVVDSPEFDHFVSGLFLPFQHLVALMMRVKEQEEREIGELAKRKTLRGLPRYEIAQALKERFNTGIQKKWGVSLEHGGLVELKQACFKIIPLLREKLGGMMANLHSRPSQKEFKEQLTDDGYPLVYQVMLSMFDQLEGLIADLEEQLEKVECGLHVLYLPVMLNHHLNDLALIKLIRLHECLQVILQELSVEKDMGRLALWQRILHRTQVYPAYHCQYTANLHKAEQCWPRFEGGDADDLKRVIERLQLDAINEYLANERDLSAKQPIVHRMIVTGKNSSRFDNLVPLVDRKVPNPHGMSVSETLEEGLAKMTMSLHRGKIFQRKLQALIQEMVDMELPEEAELLVRIYQVQSNHINFFEHNEAEQKYANWRKQEEMIGQLIQNKRRAELGLRVAGLPAAAPAPAESAPAETSTTKTT